MLFYVNYRKIGQFDGHFGGQKFNFSKFLPVNLFKVIINLGILFPMVFV